MLVFRLGYADWIDDTAILDDQFRNLQFSDSYIENIIWMRERTIDKYATRLTPFTVLCLDLQNLDTIRKY